MVDTVSALLRLVRRAARQPLVHFLVLGGLLFALQGTFGQRAPATTASARSPDELLLAAARARGYQRSDPIVRKRLARNMRFLHPDDRRSDAQLADEALELGLDQGDLVVRRRLVQKMMLQAWDEADRRGVDPAELDAMLDRGDWPERPARVRISQVFLSRDRRGAALAEDARRLGASLKGVTPAESDRFGDPFLHGTHLPDLTVRELDNLFGPGFGEALAAAPTGAWSGPYASSYGLHWVWVHERTPAQRVSREEARAALLERVRLRHRDEAFHHLLAKLGDEAYAEGPSSSFQAPRRVGRPQVRASSSR